MATPAGPFRPWRWACSPAPQRPVEFTRELAAESVQRKAVQYDRDGDSHYDSISALIKSIRGSDPDAALYWLARMLEGGEDVRFLARRLVILASEDVGNADPAALPLAVAAAHGCELVGLPECQLTLAQAVTYLACAPKSNAATVGIGEARKDVSEGRLLPVPVHLRDSHYAGRQAAGPRAGLPVCPRRRRRHRRAGLPGRPAAVLSPGRSRLREGIGERLKAIRAVAESNLECGEGTTYAWSSPLSIPAAEQLSPRMHTLRPCTIGFHPVISRQVVNLS